ncbi:uncharacterized protein LOC119080683 [Bradysia coprophila]|uniref:uncharacterized protein LOC119080683 n=1 Tax=Bradysia coprophila TaxID=38358 RepID=UPI00187D6EC4|nr:uncharacterized protein LOC119080683 [Bradysia coprophila]
MPKYKLRRAGEDSRVHKGKCASVINFDITEQCIDEDVPINCDSYVDYQAEDTGKVDQIDTRTFDEIMSSAFDECTSKSYQIRSDALTTVCTQLQLTHNPDFLKKNHDRLSTILKSSLESNVPCEIDAAASVISLAAIQMPDNNRFYQTFHKSLKDILSNCEYQKSSTRFAVFHAIGILTFLHETNGYRIAKTMCEFKDIFAHKADYDNNAKKTNLEAKVAALETWTFMMTLIPPGCDIKPVFQQYSVGNFLTLLEYRSDVMRTTCAKAIAMIIECGVEQDTYCLESELPRILDQIKSPVEVRHYLENGIAPRRELRNGNNPLILDNWASIVQYDMLCNVIGPANVIKHIAKNKKLLAKLDVARSTKRTTYSPTSKGAHQSIPSKQPVISPSTPVRTMEYDSDKILKFLHLATNKSSEERVKALEEICKECHSVPQTFLADHESVLLDIIVKAMKRGNEPEQLAAVRLATLTVFQLGRTERFCSEISNLFLNILRRLSSSNSTNASICSALAFIELMDNENSDSTFLEPAMSLFRQIFAGNHSNRKTMNKDSAEELPITLRTKALEAWTLLLTLCSPEDVCSTIDSQQIKELTDLMLQNPTVEFRIACGQVISLIVERGRISECDYLKSDILDICCTIKDIINDRKNTTGDKRIFQNTNLREVLKYLEDGHQPSFRLQFANELHELKTWSSIIKHHKLSQFIGPNLATYFLENDRIRGIIPIGLRPSVHMFSLSQNTQHKLSQAAQKKSKTKENRLNSKTPKYDCL